MQLKNMVKESIDEFFLENDTYSSYKGLKPYQQRKNEFINSIKSFNDIDSNKINEILEYFGYEGFNSKEEAFNELSEKIKEYQKLPNPVKLYRIVGVKNKKMIKKGDLGNHWTPHKWNLDGDMLMSIGYELWEDDVFPYVIEALIPHSEIDIIQTIIQNLSFPNEHEITLKTAGKAKILRIYKLDI